MVIRDRSIIALKGQNVIAQGNALGKWPNKTLSPERAKGFGIRLLRPFRAYLMGDLLPGVALRFTPGYHISPLRGLGTTARHSPRKRGNPRILKAKNGPRIRWAPFGNLRDRGSHRAADVNLPVITNQKNRCGP